jgi:pimeloyl-ACP methyl ester carboxylesterase
LCRSRGEPILYADNRGVRIHYRVEGEGPPLVLQHGTPQCVEDWYEKGYVDALKADYRLILVDARGHGQSDKPHDPTAYSLEKHAADVVSALDALALAKAHFWGYSMGGWIGFGMAKYALERVDRLVIGASHPYARNQEAARQFFQAHLGDSADDFVMAVEARYRTQVSPAQKARLRSADRHALLALSQNRPELSDIPPAMRMPCCLYSGEADPLFPQVEAASRQIPKAVFFSLPGLSHTGAFRSSDLVVPRVTAFLSGNLQSG